MSRSMTFGGKRLVALTAGTFLVGGRSAHGRDLGLGAGRSRVAPAL